MSIFKIHSEQRTTQQRGSLFSLPFGGWGGLMLLLVLSSLSSFAQNTGAGPYRNSWHTYRVVVGSTLDSRQWDITDGASITRPLDGTEAWCDIAALSGSNADISICFADSVFASDGPWYLRYREISASTGACTAARQFTINLTVNNFYLTLDADFSDCKPESGQAFRWEQLEDIDFPCSYSFMITMHKEASFNINHWAFDGTVTFDNGTHSITSYTASVVTANGGAINALTDVGVPYGVVNDGVFRVEVSAPVTVNLTEVSILVTLNLSGFVYNGVTATLTLTNGIINSGASGVTLANDNLGRPTAVEEPVAALRDREQSVTFLPLPPTPNITVSP